MSNATSTGADPYAATLVVRRVIRATPQRLFEAWTEPAQLVHWWGPQGVECHEARVDLRAGGHYRIGNRFPDGRVLWIEGTFERIERPTSLVYSWHIEGSPHRPERVAVQFLACADGTEVIVTHERIIDNATRDQHALGWAGCLDGLSDYLRET